MKLTIVVYSGKIRSVTLKGEMAERLKASDSKSDFLQGNGGSNPSLSAFARHSGLRRIQSAIEERDGGHFNMNVNYCVYILTCNDKKLYIGCTSNLKERIERHRKGNVPATQNRLPIELMCYISFRNKHLAYNFEKYLKSGSGRVFLKRHLL